MNVKQKAILFILVTTCVWVPSLLRAETSECSEWSARMVKSGQNKECLPVLSGNYPGADRKTAYMVQKALVKALLVNNTCAGFKAGLTSEGSQKRFGVNGPVCGVLFAEGRYDGSPSIRLSDFKKLMLEAEIGFVVGKAITAPISDIKELRDCIRGVMPVIELPDLCFDQPGKLKGLDIIAGNVAVAAFIRGEEKPPGTLDLNAVSVTLLHNGNTLFTGRACDVGGDQWKTALWLVNTIIKQGRRIKPGYLLITGAIGKMVPGKPGAYTADYGNFGKITFEVSAGK
ncbi:MAG: 4-oxalocrotonate decarboxylase [bacterium]|nr:4-oxalocrotonate decarboxylase [bacterium]